MKIFSNSVDAGKKDLLPNKTRSSVYPFFLFWFKWELCRVIQIWQKWQIWYFAIFSTKFRIFWKIIFGKMQKNFWYHHSNACQKCPKVLLHNAPMWIRVEQKIEFFVVFQKENRILLFEYFVYMKNVIFWGTLSWCSSKIGF